MTIFPNTAHPNDDLTIIGLSDKEYSFELFTMQGQRVLKSEVSNSKVILNNEKFERGTYFYVIMGSDERISGKMIFH